MNNLKDRERASILDIVSTFKNLNDEDKNKLLYIGVGMNVASGLANGINDNTTKGNA